MRRFGAFVLGLSALSAAAIPLAASAQDEERSSGRDGGYGRSGAGYYGRDHDRYDEGWNRRPYRYGEDRWGGDRGRFHEDRESARDDDNRTSERSGTSTSQSGRGVLDRLLAEHAETEKTLQQVRPLLQEARNAVQQNDRPRAEQALTRAESLLSPAQDSRRQIERSLDDLEQAVRRNDRDAADQALQRAREAVQQSAAAQTGSGGNTTTQSGSNTSGTSTSGTSGGSGTTSGGPASGATSKPQ